MYQERVVGTSNFQSVIFLPKSKPPLKPVRNCRTIAGTNRTLDKISIFWKWDASFTRARLFCYLDYLGNDPDVFVPRAFRS